MTPEQFARVESLFEGACAQPPDARGDWLREHCPDDPEVLRKVEGMLTHDAVSMSPIDTPAMGSGFHVGKSDEIEQRVREEFAAAGRYQIESLLGEGGFGSVYRAEQIEPVRRHVALKVIKLGMDTRRILARFEAERQTLARMSHPGIAKFLDAGITASGRSYFVMELVDGKSITNYCDECRLDTRARLALFSQVCEAIRHAHQKGVLHRDIKPSNVLITSQDGKPRPIVIDFGIARALDDDSGEMSLMTQQGQMIGTPEYMSPEQAEGSRDIDTRTDIYSLGVLLYELLTGTTPIERPSRRNASLMEWQRLIRDSEPPTPSTRVRKSGERGDVVARGRRTDPSTLSKELQGDLDWIVMKAIEKDRSRRYETVDAFATDIERYLRDEPVLARPQSAAYRFRKLARRNRTVFVASSALALTLVIGILGTSIGLVQARRSAESARTESEISRAITAFLIDDLLSAARPESQGKDVAVRAVVDEAARRVDGRFTDQPLIEAGIRLALGGTYRALGLLDEADKHTPLAYEIRARSLGPDAADTLEGQQALALLRSDQGRFEESERLNNDVLARRRRMSSEIDEATLSVLFDLARNYTRMGRTREAERLYREILDVREKTLGEEAASTLAARGNLISVLQAENRLAEAAALIERTLDAQERTLGKENPYTLYTRGNLAVNYQRTNRLDESAALYEDLLESMRRVFGGDHPNTLYVIGDMCLVYEKQGRFADVERLRLEIIRGLKKSLGPDHPETLIAREHLGDFYYRQKRAAEAEPLYIAVLDSNRKIFGAEHAYTRATQLRLARTCLALNRPTEAEALLMPLVRFARETSDAKLTDYLIEYGRTLTRLSRPEQAEAVMAEVLGSPLNNSTLPEQKRQDAMNVMIELYDAWNKPAQAAEWRAKLNSGASLRAAAGS